MEEEDREKRELDPLDTELEELLIGTALDLREVTEILIARREVRRDDAIRAVKHEADSSRDELEDLDRRGLTEELRCFRDVLKLYRRTRDDD